MQLEVGGTLELSDIRHAYRWTHVLQEQEIRGANPVGLDRLLFGPFFLIVAVILGLSQQPFIAFASALVGLLLFFPGLAHLPRHLYWQWVILPSQYQEQTNLFQIRWRIDDLGLDLSDARPSERRYAWTDYARYAEDETGYLLYWWPQPGQDVAELGEREQIVHYLPRRFFTPEQASAFSDFLKAKFSSSGTPAERTPG